MHVHYHIAGAQMWELTEIVIPKIKAEWESLAYCMRYTPEEVNGFRKDYQDCGECCKNLLTNWISTDHIPKPKTYQTLLKYIRKVDKLTTASETIEKELIKGNKQKYIHIAIQLFNSVLYYYSPTGSRRIMVKL